MPVSIGLAVVILAVAAALANVALLGSAGEDRLGRLRPVESGLTTTTDEAVTAPVTTTGPSIVPTRTDEADHPRGPYAPGDRDDADD
jgi:hypothetical protein